MLQPEVWTSFIKYFQMNHFFWFLCQGTCFLQASRIIGNCAFCPKSESLRARIKTLMLSFKYRFLASIPSFPLSTNRIKSRIYWYVYFLLNNLVFCFIRILKGIYFFRQCGLVERALDLKQHLNVNSFNGIVTLGR